VAVTIRVVAGSYIKLDAFAAGGANDNTYFMFAVIAFTALFGTRKLFVFITLIMVACVSSFPAIIALQGLSENIWPYMAGTLNIVISLIVVFSLSFMMSRITENALFITQEKLDANKALSDELTGKVEELQSMYREMEGMNSEIAESAREVLKTNTELRLFKEIADASTQGFMMFDPEGKIIYMNRAMMKIISGSGTLNAYARRIEDFYPEKYRAFFHEKIMPAVTDTNSWSGELPVLSSRGMDIPTLQNVILIRDDSGSPIAYANVVTDLTVMKKLEAQLIQSQKLEAVGRLAGGIAHDFNNYLTAIIGYSSLIISRNEPNDPICKDAMEIIRVAENSAHLVRQLLTFSRGQMLRPIVLNINDVINEMINMLERVLGEDIQIRTVLDGKLGNARLDPAQIEQVILNLAINARDAMPRGGRLTIRTKNAALSENDCADLDDASPGDYVCIIVEDSGIGIPAGQMKNIFEPFFSTKESGKGTGLGLSVIYGIVKQHGGWIHVESEVGIGSSFTICFPVVSDSKTIKQKNDVPLKNLAGNGERILLVEDHREVQRFASIALSKNGYMVFEASTVYDALMVFNRENGKFQVVFTDVVLPDKSGIDLVHAIKDKHPAMPILLCSGYTDKEKQLQEIIEGNYNFLKKPYTIYDLLMSIRTTIYPEKQH
jgi:PAS domain S-box-containing protein